MQQIAWKSIYDGFFEEDAEITAYFSITEITASYIYYLYVVKLLQLYII